jgi:hypothetical protein
MLMDHETVVAYLDRIGVTAPAACDAAGLRTLHRAAGPAPLPETAA